MFRLIGRFRERVGGALYEGMDLVWACTRRNRDGRRDIDLVVESRRRRVNLQAP